MLCILQSMIALVFLAINPKSINTEFQGNRIQWIQPENLNTMACRIIVQSTILPTSTGLTRMEDKQNFDTTVRYSTFVQRLAQGNK